MMVMAAFPGSVMAMVAIVGRCRVGCLGLRGLHGILRVRLQRDGRLRAEEQTWSHGQAKES
jgi:hypothetical protein